MHYVGNFSTLEDQCLPLPVTSTVAVTATAGSRRRARVGTDRAERAGAYDLDMPVSVLAKTKVAEIPWNHISFRRGSAKERDGRMKVHFLERALTAGCIIAAITVVWWGV